METIKRFNRDLNYFWPKAPTSKEPDSHSPLGTGGLSVNNSSRWRVADATIGGKETRVHSLLDDHYRNLWPTSARHIREMIDNHSKHRRCKTSKQFLEKVLVNSSS